MKQTLFIAAILLLVVSVKAAEDDYRLQVLQDNPVAYFEFDESSGTDAVDSSDTSNDGTYDSGVTVNQPSVIGLGTCILLDGTANATMVAPDDSAYFVGSEPLTIEYWLKITSQADVEFMSVFNLKSDTTEMDTRHEPKNWEGIRVYENNFSQGQADYTQANEWAYYAFVRTETNWIFYVNGTQSDIICCDEDAALGFGGGTGEDCPLRVGRINVISDKHSYYEGYVDEVAFYDTALSAERILAHYDTVPIPEPGLLILLSTGLAGMVFFRNQKG
jgi:hypothetical protein